jgi:hypothetical protein
VNFVRALCSLPAAICADSALGLDDIGGVLHLASRVVHTQNAFCDDVNPELVALASNLTSSIHRLPDKFAADTLRLVGFLSHRAGEPPGWRRADAPTKLPC